LSTLVIKMNQNSELSGIAYRLKTAREYMGFSPSEIEKITKLNAEKILGFENDSLDINRDEINILAKVYRKSTEYLLTGEDRVDSEPVQFSFLARAKKGLSDNDLDEISHFANFLKASNKS